MHTLQPLLRKPIEPINYPYEYFSFIQLLSIGASVSVLTLHMTGSVIIW